MELVVAVVFQSKEPVAVVDKTEVPLQLLTTFTTGVEIVDPGEAVPVPEALVQLPEVAVTL